MRPLCSLPPAQLARSTLCRHVHVKFSLNRLNLLSSRALHEGRARIFNPIPRKRSHDSLFRTPSQATRARLQMPLFLPQPQRRA